jgi:8-amino-7-oxononanoate synthase
LKKTDAIEYLKSNISYFNERIANYNLTSTFIKSSSAIHCCILPGNNVVKTFALSLQEKGFDVKPILSPTVADGEERLRICLHSYNTHKEIDALLTLFATL